MPWLTRQLGSACMGAGNQFSSMASPASPRVKPLHTPSAARVWVPATPSAVSGGFFNWYAFTASWVLRPYAPSTVPLK